jgi:hypothetical protein
MEEIRIAAAAASIALWRRSGSMLQWRIFTMWRRSGLLQRPPSRCGGDTFHVAAEHLHNVEEIRIAAAAASALL